MGNVYVQGKEQIAAVGYDSLITLDANGLVDIDTTHTQGSVVSITNTPASACTANILKVDVQSTPFSSGNCVHVVSADADCEGVKINQSANNTEFISIGKTGTTYTTLGIGSSDQLKVQTTANDKIRLLPNGTGYTAVGSGTPDAMSSSNDNIYVTNDLEIDGQYWADAGAMYWPGVTNRTTRGYKFSLADEAFVGTNHDNQSMMVRIMIGNNIGWAIITVNAAGFISKKSGTSNVNVNSSVNGYFCMYTTAGYLAYHNRLGSAQVIGTYEEIVYLP